MSAPLLSLPDCAQTCLIQASEISTCAADDTACACNSPSYHAEASSCILSSCNVRESLASENVTSTLCGISPDSSRHWQVALIFFTVLAGLAIILRLVSKFWVAAKLAWDDIFAFIAYGATVGTAATLLMCQPLGLGRHIWSVSFENITRIQQLCYIATQLYNFARFATRASILLFCIHVFSGNEKPKFLIAALVLGTILFINNTIVLFLQCRPLNYIWFGWDGEYEGNCVDRAALYYALNGIGIVYDLFVMMAPIPYIYKLNLQTRRKLLVSTMFTVGLCVFGITIYRLKVLPIYLDSVDPTADGVPFLASSGIEINMAVFCACMPSIRSLVAKISPKDGLSWGLGGIIRSKSSGMPSSRTKSDPALWRYGQQGQDSVNAHGGIRVTHLTSVTTTQNEDATRMGTYYPLQDMDPVLRQFTAKADGPRVS